MDYGKAIRMIEELMGEYSHDVPHERQTAFGLLGFAARRKLKVQEGNRTSSERKASHRKVRGFFYGE